jgi:hypothetical protein
MKFFALAKSVDSEYRYVILINYNESLRKLVDFATEKVKELNAQTADFKDLRFHTNLSLAVPMDKVFKLTEQQSLDVENNLFIFLTDPQYQVLAEAALIPQQATLTFFRTLSNSKGPYKVHMRWEMDLPGGTFYLTHEPLVEEYPANLSLPEAKGSINVPQITPNHQAKVGDYCLAASTFNYLEKPLWEAKAKVVRVISEKDDFTTDAFAQVEEIVRKGTCEYSQESEEIYTPEIGSFLRLRSFGAPLDQAQWLPYVPWFYGWYSRTNQVIKDPKGPFIDASECMREAGFSAKLPSFWFGPVEAKEGNLYLGGTLISKDQP